MSFQVRSYTVQALPRPYVLYLKAFPIWARGESFYILVKINALMPKQDGLAKTPTLPQKPFEALSVNSYIVKMELWLLGSFLHAYRIH